MNKDIFEIVDSFENFSKNLNDYPFLKDEFSLIFQELLNYKKDLCIKTFIYDKKQFDDIVKYETIDFFDKKCPYCGLENFHLRPTRRNQRAGENDHFIPVAKGGRDVVWNILYVCFECNRAKKDMMPEIFLKDKPDVYQKCVEYTNDIKDKYYNPIQSKIEGYNAIKKYFQKYLSFLEDRNVYEIVNFLVEIAQLFECSEDKIRKIQEKTFPKDNELTEDEKIRLDILSKAKNFYIKTGKPYTPRVIAQNHGSKKYQNKKINAKVAKEILYNLESDGYGRCEKVRTSIGFIPFMSEESE